MAHHEVCLRMVIESERRLSRHLSRAGRSLAWRYSRVIFTRGDFYWLQRHPGLDILDSSYVWLPHRLSSGGVCDRHAVLNRSAAMAYLRVGQRAEVLFAGREAVVTGEEAIEATLRGWAKAFMPLAAHSVVPTATTPGDAASARSGGVRGDLWGRGTVGAHKNALAAVAQQAFLRAPRGCEVPRHHARSSQDVAGAHAEAACLAARGSAPIEVFHASAQAVAPCGPHAAPPFVAQASREEDLLQICLARAPLFHARFLADAFGKPGTAGLSLYVAASSSTLTPEDPLRGEMLEAAELLLRRGCSATRTCERMVGENIMGVYCSPHFCGGLHDVLQLLGRAGEAAAVLAAIPASTQPLPPLLPGACRDVTVLPHFGHRTVDFAGSTYCFVG
eukprot:TRINITY_DN30809_c0_g1_i1.p3 TRINITY_DN30809_c0_g1~~TRINITY_DN30809_c0_g1_i1.p3  ORF type:complete len:390 (-),score=77.57 TRINITY_DN30809_c0_g1_i1:122-1291(-)